ncbi:MAG: SpoVG family protein [Elusimicrobia bacterium]|nr:SpoVG family protein [Elusimicrobiota bacterium]
MIYKSQRFMLALFFLLCFAQYGFCQSLRVTGISKDNNIFDITFNNALLVRGARLFTMHGQTNVLFHERQDLARNRRQFFITNRNFRNYLVSALENDTTEAEVSAESVSFRIIKFNRVNFQHTRALASVVFNNSLEVECRVMESSRGLWISWPASPQDGTWERSFAITDENLRAKVEAALLIKYKNERNILN